MPSGNPTPRAPGTLALRTGSVWCGVLLHVSVALSMDLLASWHGHHLPTRLWPY